MGWIECKSCGGRYLPSKTSDLDECGVCFPVKNKKLVKREAFNPSFTGELHDAHGEGYGDKGV